ncbi:MAG TPA: glycosyltransferase family A protein, partial [Gemmata sp.]
VVADGPLPLVGELCEQFAARLPLRFLENPGPFGMWGHHARNWVMDARQARGAYLMALDDDDEYTPGAIAAARAAFGACPEPRPHIFRMTGHPICPPEAPLLWREPVFQVGNFGTPCIAAPNDPGRLGRYGMHYTGDFDFAETTCAHYARGPVWCEAVVCRVRPIPPT